MAGEAWVVGNARERLDLLDVGLFVRAAALANLSSAAREFGLSPAVASARIAGLERMLGARLLHRTTRRVSVTQEGEIFAAHARELLDAAEAAYLAADSRFFAAVSGRDCGSAHDRSDRRSGR